MKLLMINHLILPFLLTYILFDFMEICPPILLLVQICINENKRTKNHLSAQSDTPYFFVAFLVFYLFVSSNLYYLLLMRCIKQMDLLQQLILFYKELIFSFVLCMFIYV